MRRTKAQVPWTIPVILMHTHFLCPLVICEFEISKQGRWRKLLRGARAKGLQIKQMQQKET